MSDFDLSLIREFRSRPAFYDRNSPLFKDKVFNAQAWQEISNILGYDVALLKDRMLQLRNRYNLEKRRLEQLSEENPGKYIHSPWPLYDHLGFLSEHIRSRRSFKRMLPRQASTDLNTGRGTAMSPAASDSAYAAAPLANGMLAVKLENATEAESDSQSGETGAPEDDQDKDNTIINDQDAVAGAAVLTNLRNRSTNSFANHNQVRKTSHLRRPLHHRPSSISIRNLDSMRATIPKHRKLHGRSSSDARISSAREEAADTATFMSIPEKKRFLSVREQKYEAFGNFVASSLEEMPKRKALRLVERFTAEMVRILIEKNLNDSKKAAAAAAAAAAAKATAVSGLEDDDNKCHTSMGHTMSTTAVTTTTTTNTGAGGGAGGGGGVGGGNRTDDAFQKPQQQQLYQSRS